MKKVLTILMLMVLASCLFAASSDTIKLKVTISKIDPVFTIAAKFGDADYAAGSTIDSKVDISDTDVKVSFKLIQTKASDGNGGFFNGSKFNGTASLSVTATVLSDTSKNYYTKAVTISNAAKGTTTPSTGSRTITVGTVSNVSNASASTDSASVGFTVALAGKVSNVGTDGDVVGTFDITWAQDDTLPANMDLTSTITLTYTAQ